MTQDQTDKVIDAANHTVDVGAATTSFLTAMQNTVNSFCAALAREVTPEERIALVVPGQVQATPGSKYNPGALLLAENRVILTWLEGTARSTTPTRTATYADISDVTTDVRKAGFISAKNTVIDFTMGGDEYTFMFFTQHTQKSLESLVEGMLAGWASPTWDDGPVTTGPVD